MEWVNELNKDYQQAPSWIQAYSMDSEKYTVIVNHHTGVVAKAMCHPNDAFNKSIGIAVAWARYRGYEIPRETVDISKLKYGQKFKVARVEDNPTGVFIGENPINKGRYLFTYEGQIIRSLPKNTQVILID